MPLTTRRQLPKPATSAPPDVPSDLGALADALDNFGVDLFGLRSALPAIGAGGGQMSAEDDGTLYYATDTHELLRYVHSVGAWKIAVGPARKLYNATEQTRSTTSFGSLTTPDDLVVVMPADGLLFLAAQGQIKMSVADTASVAIFLDSNQVKRVDDGSGSIIVQAGQAAMSASVYRPFSSTPLGMQIGLGSTAYTGDVATGQILGVDPNGGGSDGSSSNNIGGGVATIFAAAGTYTVGLRYKPNSGTVLVKERKLWVWTQEFE